MSHTKESNKAKYGPARRKGLWQPRDSGTTYKSPKRQNKPDFDPKKWKADIEQFFIEADQEVTLRNLLTGEAQTYPDIYTAQIALLRDYHLSRTLMQIWGYCTSSEHINKTEANANVSINFSKNLVTANQRSLQSDTEK